MQKTTTQKTAILVFALSGKEEAQHKSIPLCDLLFDELTDQTLRTVEKSRLPYFHFTKEEQNGATFGERFTNAIHCVFEKGFEHVITIGNDAPQLQTAHLLETEKQLNNNSFVLGPSVDGGFYLMGLHRHQFHKKAFQELSWQTSKLSKQLLHLIGQSKSVFRLPALLDIDTTADIKSFVSFSNDIPEKLLRIVLNIIGEPKKIVLEIEHLTKTLHFNLPPNKGSPFSNFAA